MPLLKEDKKFGLFIRCFDPFERICFLLLVLFFLAGVVGAVFYELFGRRVIQAAYNGDSLPFLNQLIQYQHKYPVEHYLELADACFCPLVLRGLSIVGVLILTLLLFYEIIFTDKQIRVVYPILIGLVFVSLTYLLSPVFRIYSIHGFYRVGIAYQILQGFVPPRDPLFAGAVVHAPWGYPWLIAMLTGLLQISSFWVTASINLLCLGLCMFLVYLLSMEIFQDRKMALFSMIIAFFAITPIPKFLAVRIGDFLGFYSPFSVGIPLVTKFLTINGVPLGCLFFLLFLFCIIRYFQTPRVGYAVGVLLTLVACGFFYIPMFPGLAGGLAFIIVFNLLTFKYRLLSPDYRHSIYLSVILIFGVLLLVPYVRTVFAGGGASLDYFSLSSVLNNSLNFMLFLSPLLALLFLARGVLLRSSHPTALTVILCILVANTLAYLALHFMEGLEYKFLLMTQISLGILAGAAFRFLRERSRIWTFLVLTVFCIPSVERLWIMVHRYGNRPLFPALSSCPVYEKGTRLYSADPQKAELYEWIWNHTDPDSIFIDSVLEIPVLAQRLLYFGQEAGAPGYNVSAELLQRHHRYDPVEYERRKCLVRSLYGGGPEASRDSVLVLLEQEDVYIVIRNQEGSSSIQLPEAWKLFTSTGGAIHVYHPNPEKFVTVDSK